MNMLAQPMSHPMIQFSFFVWSKMLKGLRPLETEEEATEE